MAKIAAPKSLDYDTRTVIVKRHSDIQALRKKTNWTQADRDKIIQILMDHVLDQTSVS